jgi:hypothetical protein
LNGFLRETELISLQAYTSDATGGVFRRYRLALGPQGFCLLGNRNSRLCMVWLPHRSYWTTRIAAISLRQTIAHSNAKLRVLWFLRGEQAPDGWRRASVLLGHPPGAGA